MAQWYSGYGRYVEMKHVNGFETGYGHMSRIEKGIKPGVRVRQGQVIGYVGSTGLSTGPHLHYELYKDGVPINPMSVKFVMRSQLAGNDLAAFRAKLRGLLSVPIGGATRMAQATGPNPRDFATTSPPRKQGSRFRSHADEPKEAGFPLSRE
jgi:hypothetical protein